MKQVKQKGGFAPSIMGGIANAAYLAPIGIKQMYKFYTRKQARSRKQSRKSQRKSRKVKRRG
jgi:hypothetical protein